MAKKQATLAADSMTMHPGDSPDKMLLRERLFARLRLAGLVLLAAGFVLDPRPISVPLVLVLQVIGAGIMLTLAAWALLRFQRINRTVTLVGASGDVLFLLFFITISGGFGSPLWPLVFILIAAATLRYGTWGGITTALAFAGINIGFGVLGPGGSGSLDEAVVRSLVFVAVALVLGWVILLERRQTGLESEQTQQALQRSQSEVKSFAALTDTMSSNTNYQATLGQMLELSLRSLRSRGQTDDSMAGMILLFSAHPSDALLVAAQVQLDKPDEARHLSPIRGGIKTVLNAVEPIMLRDARRDPLLGQFDIIQKYPSAAILPLRSGLMMFGVAVFMGHEKLLDVFSQRLELMEAYTSQAAIAVQNAQLFAQLDAERNSVVDSEERVRHELARDLHDGPLNQVASLAMGLDFARLLIDKEPQKAREELINLQRLAAKTARDMRTTMYRLRPLALESAGLSAALEQYISRLKADHDKPELHFEAPDAAAFEKRLSVNAATMVFDIMNEAIGNALKHSEAQNIWVELHSSGNVLVASTRDDGKGFDVAAVQAGYTSRGSLGMVNIHERAALAQGDASIESEPGHGTTVSVRVPSSA
jgi:signal transduction histidine kinase